MTSRRQQAWIEARIAKLNRLQQGGAVRCLDLFAGCGGLSLGFQAMGYTICGAVEHDPIAARSHADNLFKELTPEEREIHAKARDVATSPKKFAREIGLRNGAAAIDIIIGGPPCQAFARVGRAKLREIAAHPEAFRRDERADLYLHYLAFVEFFQPLVVVLENVPDVINYGGHNIPEEISEALEDQGYNCRYTLLNSVFYGVPQMRERMFLIAFANEMRADVAFPETTYYHRLPQGYEGSRQVALKALPNLFGNGNHFVRPPGSSIYLPPAVTAKEALDDLPRITAHLEGRLRRGARRFTDLTQYPSPIEYSDYARLMRTWRGYENNEGVFDHVIRYLPRDYAIFRRLKAGDQYPEAHRLALQMLEEEVERRLLKRKSAKERETLRKHLRKEIVPPYDPNKFPNKWRKMEPDAPARTLMAHLGKDSYSHIHYDSTQARTISVREAARLQSFPDGFKFSGTMNPAFRQIGNAVPPLMAKAIAEKILESLPVRK